MGSLSLRRASLVAIGASVRIDLLRHQHVCVTPDPHDHPRMDFQSGQQRCAGPPRIVNRHVADTGLIASSCETPVEGPWIDRRPALTGEHTAVGLSPFDTINATAIGTRTPRSATDPEASRRYG
jgi:hypothetical protein